MLTDREQIAISMMSNHPDIVRANIEKQTEIIVDALSFADLFLDIARDGQDSADNAKS